MRNADIFGTFACFLAWAVVITAILVYSVSGLEARIAKLERSNESNSRVDWSQTERIVELAVAVEAGYRARIFKGWEEGE